VGSIGSGSWIDEISVSGRIPERLHPSLPLSLTAGNLAALEDDELISRTPTRSDRSASAVAGSLLVAPAPRAPVATSAPPPPIPSSQPPPDKKAGAATKVGVVVALLMMAAGAAAWFTHVIPHP
jgi:hypothetical protein